MTTISATQVKSLRDKTGVSMGDCKKALVESAGDESQAIEILSKKYAGQMSMRSDKEAANGRIGVYADGTTGALVEFRCETDFVANNEDFKTAADAIAKVAAKTGVTDPDKLMDEKIDDGSTVKELVATTYGKLKENMSIARAEKIENGVACYVHHNGLLGAIVAADGAGDQTARQICMHIAAQSVLKGLTRDNMDPTEVEKARALMAEQAQGKPPQIVEKIVTGKMNKWFAERVLLEQPFAMDDKKTVEQVAKEAGINIAGYLKFELGSKSA